MATRPPLALSFYRLFGPAHRDRLTRRIASGLGQARQEFQIRQLCHCPRADEEYGKRVAGYLGIGLTQMLPSHIPATA